jgi:hypothetical protein
MAKVTKRERFIQLRGIVEDALTSTDTIDRDAVTRMELLGFIDNELDLLDRKRGKSNGMTKEQLINEGIKMDIVSFLNTVDEATATEVANAMDIAVQKATALLTQLVKNTKSVERVTDGKKVRFRTIA